jgi:hypothetical protein
LYFQLEKVTETLSDNEDDDLSGTGLDSRLTELKTKYNDQLEWGRIFVVGSECRKVVQFAWKDSATVLFQSTVGNPYATVVRDRKRPSNATKKTTADWGDKFVKPQPIPQVIDDYNHRMNAVDISDQMRASYSTQRRQYRTWKPLFFFLFETALINAYKIGLEQRLLSQDSKNSGHFLYREQLALQLMAEEREKRAALQSVPAKNKPTGNGEHMTGHFTMEDGCKGTMEKLGLNPKNCKACTAARRSCQTRNPLQEVSLNSVLQSGSVSKQASRDKLPRSTFGCSKCKIILCQQMKCWRNHDELIAN